MQHQKRIFIPCLASLMFLFSACGKSSGDSGGPDPAPPAEARLLQLDLEFGGSTFNTVIDGNTVSLDRDLPYGTTQAKVKQVYVAQGNTVDIKAGDVLDLAGSPYSITVKHPQAAKQVTYSLQLRTRPYATIVEKNGLLRTSGSKIVNKDGVPVSFAGNSFFWSNAGWGGDRFYTEGTVAWLDLDWGTTIVRAAMGVDEQGGYLQYKEANLASLKAVVDAAIKQGLYVIIDWHSHHAEDHRDEAVQFFSTMAATYGKYDNVIYEIYNEPLNISWGGTLKPYAEAVITAIRKEDPDNMIIVGTPEWSQQVDKPAADPITISTNIAYTLHFYTKYHTQWLRDRAAAALNRGIALVITEWGSIGYTRNDPETDKWMTWCKDNGITHCNWSVNDKQEEWSVLRQGASSTGGWAELTEAGYLTRGIIRKWGK